MNYFMVQAYSEYNICFKITTRTRPNWFRETVESIMNLANNNRYFILVSADIDDTTMYNKEMALWCAQRGIVIIYGTSKNKIDAINRDVLALKKPNWDILVNVSDDQRFLYKGFDEDIRKEFAQGLDLFVHFPDNNRADICTMSIMGKDYYLRDNYIYHPDYISICCDEEATEVAKIRGRYRFNEKILIKHLHPGYGTAQWDNLYIKNEAQDISDKDRETLRFRRFAGFHLKS